MASENGWEPSHAPPDLLEWRTVPGTSPPVRLQFMKGWPSTVLTAFAADYNAYVERLRDGDSAAFTPENKVDDSNHLNGSAADLNWDGEDGKTFRLGITEEQAYPGDKARNLRELLAFYNHEGLQIVFCGGNWDIRDWMHFQMDGNTWKNPKVLRFIEQRIRPDGFSTYKREGAPPAPPVVTGTYGLPPGSNSGGYGGNGVRFPDWVYQLGNAFGVKPSTYPGHQESDRNEAGYAPNPQHLNRAIDWAAPGAPDEIDRLTRFADYLATIPQFLEQVIWRNPHTGRSIEVAGGRHQPGYFSADLAGHQDHVHTRQSRPIPLPGGPPPPPPPAPPLSRADGYALAIIAEGRRRNVTPRGIQIALSVALVESNLQMYANASVPESMGIPHDKVGSDHDSVGLFQQRCPMWGPAHVLMNPALSAGLFYDRLVSMDYNNPNRLPGDFAADVQRPAAQYRGRYQERMGDAVALYNRLVTGAPPPPPLPEEGFLMALSEQEQRNLYNAIMGMHHEYMDPVPSLSPLAKPGEGNIGNIARIVRQIDSNAHVVVEKELSTLRYPDPDAIESLNEVANVDLARFPERARDRKLARAILLEGSSAPTPQPVTPAVSRPEVVYLPAPEPAASPGQILGQAYDALEALQLSNVLSDAERAPLAALIAVLSTKTTKE